MLRLGCQSGHVVRIGPNELSFDTIASRNDIYSHKGAKGFLKGPIYDGFINDGEPALVAVKEPGQHGKRRRFLAHAFSAQALHSQHSFVQTYCDLFVKQVEQHCTESGINMTQWYNWFTFDVIGDLAFGEPFGCLKNGSHSLLTQSESIERSFF